MQDLVVLVVDDDAAARTRLLLHLRKLGMRALGVDGVADALALTEALSADVTVVYEEAPALEPLRARCRVLRFERDEPVEATLVALLHALGGADSANALN